MGRGVWITWPMALAIALAGCGGDDGDGSSGSGSTADQRAVVDVAVAYTKAITADRDAKAACALMTEEAQEEAGRAVPGASSCERAHDVVLSVAKNDTEDAPGEMRRAKKKVTIDGDEATLVFTDLAQDKVIHFRRLGGEWKLDDNLVTFKPGQ
jgi:hypothetical protein